MMPPTPGPDQPPEGARTLYMETGWGNGSGTFWQQGPAIGMVWKQMPEWGQATPRFRASHWVLGSEAWAEWHFQKMEEDQEWQREMRKEKKG